MIRCVFRGPVGATLFVDGRPIASGEVFEWSGHAPPSGCELLDPAPPAEPAPAPKPKTSARKPRKRKPKTTTPKG